MSGKTLEQVNYNTTQFGYFTEPIFFYRRKIALLLVGLDNAGKTVAAKGLAGERLDSTVPTIGFSVIELKFRQYDVKIFDLGGGPNIRGIWHKYFVDVHGIIFVVDSCDTNRFSEVRQVLTDIISNTKIAGKPLLILANKQDQESALDEVDLIEYLKIEELVNKYCCPALVQSCSANESNYHKSDPGIKQGYEWIINYIDQNYDQLNSRVQVDTLEQEIQDKQEMLAKIERIKAERQAMARSEDPDAIQTFSEYVSKVNGNLTVTEPEILDFYPNPEEIIQSHSSSNSSIAFPEIYQVNSTYTNEKERPRSAVEIVKLQLRMNSNKEIRRSQSAKIRRNKTGPARQLKATEFKPVNGNVIMVTPRKTLDENCRVFTISKMGPAGDFYGSPVRASPLEERFELKRPSSVKRNGGENGICVVDVE